MNMLVHVCKPEVNDSSVMTVQHKHVYVHINMLAHAYVYDQK